MKGQSKRLADHKGRAYDMFVRRRRPAAEPQLGFLDLWRYASPLEIAATVAGVLLGVLCAWCLVAAISIYGDLTALFVTRSKREETVRANILVFFGGGERVSSPEAEPHRAALVADSWSFLYASLAIMALQLAAAAAAVTLTNWAARRMVSRLRWRLLRAALRQELAYFDTNKSFNFAAAVTEDMEKLLAGTGEHVAMVAYLCGSVLAAAATGAALGWQLTLAGLSVVPAALVVANLVAKYQTRYSDEEAASYGVAARGAQEALAGVRTVRAYAGEDIEVKRYVDNLAPAAAAAKKRGLCAGIGAGMGWLLTYVLNAIVLSYGARLCVRDMDLPPEEVQYHPGALLTILFCTFMAAQNIAMCHPHFELFSAARGAARSVYSLLERTSRIDALKEEGEKPEKFVGNIVFDNVYFNYPSRPDVKVLRGLSLSVPAGSTVALVGGSGCGKSTLLQLLLRLYEPASGSVTVDGRALETLQLGHYRRSIGVVGQEPVLFSGSIRDNITLGAGDVSEEQVQLAARTAHAHAFITKLADGYNTMLGESGAQLSGGQKQRIAIARAVLRRPALLLLDEPTSALDPASERQVQAALDTASQGRTTLVVSHRLSTIVNATTIVYLEQGAVREQGSYRELLARRGAFWELVQADLSHQPSMTPAIAEAPADEEADDADVVCAADALPHFTRAHSASDSVRASITSALRGSRRIGSLAAPAPLVPEATEVPESGPEELPEVSTAALLKLNAPEWRLLAGGGAAAFLVGATMPCFALLFSKIYGMFALSDPEEILSQAELFASLFAGVAGLCGLATFLQAWLFNRAGSRLTDRLRELTFSSFLRQDQGWLDSEHNSVGALCARLASDCAAVQGATGTRLGTVLQGVSTLVLGVALAAAYSWRMTLVSLLSIPTVMGGIYLESYVMEKAEAAARAGMEQASRVATEAIINIRTVQSLGVEEALLSRYAAALEAGGGGGAAARVRGLVYGLCLCAPTLGYAISLAYGGYLIAREDMPYEYAILVSEALIYGAWMLAEALSFAPNFAAARRSGARIIQIMNRTPAIVTEDSVEDDPSWSAQGTIEYKSVSFRYPTRPLVPVLRGLSLHVPAGRTVALVGASGCGKSTLMQLLMRTYDPNEGSVELDRKDIKRQLSLRRLRKQLGLVQQEPVLFDRSVRDNIAYGDNSRIIPMEEILEAARQANVHSFISSLPMGYDTNLGSGGAQLSGGQKQRIAIARALVRNPKILLLDEATSALDAGSEKIVQEALEAASKGRTTIMIAHRLATVRHADTICVIDKGVVAEQGSHAELAARGGLYAQLLEQQGALP
ncbi:unnamed protein product [Plutella xylostella]|uniref:ABC-type xenobiotic transporter n=1 Tax=Plutella xylostella TaxID=51655 RepID=A0A8S4G690_PLUXY|nr:unnamed protein product [Plutella xylostella]